MRISKYTVHLCLRRSDLQSLNPGDLILVLPEVGYRFGPQVGANWTEIHVIFSGPMFDLCRRTGMFDPGRLIHHLAPLEHWQTRLEAFVRVSPRTMQAKAQEACRLMTLLSEVLLPSETSASEAGWLTQACSLLETHLGDDLTLAQIAAQVEMPYETFRKRFRAQIGQTPVTGVTPGEFRRRQD